MVTGLRLTGDTALCPYPLVSTGLNQDDSETSLHDCRIVDWDVKHQNKQSSLPKVKIL